MPELIGIFGQVGAQFGIGRRLLIADFLRYHIQFLAHTALDHRIIGVQAHGQAFAIHHLVTHIGIDQTLQFAAIGGRFQTAWNWRHAFHRRGPC